MAEITFKSAGVKTREIDLSQPTRVGPVGVPAGIVGTSNEGPAFVPLTFANYRDFVTTFGRSDGEKFGPIAVNQWLANAQAVSYIRVLGAGNGKQRNTSTGKVTNAGFVVGDRIIQDNGIIGNNFYATGSIEGRTYFLGCFMSESNGSTIFSDAGIQKTTTISGKRATATITVTDAGEITTGNQISLVTTAGNTVTITGHADTNAMADTTGASTNGTFAANTTLSGGSSNNITQAAAIAATINLHDDFTATNGGTATVTITQNTGGTAGNGRAITVAKNGGDGDIEAPGDLTIVNFSGGSDGNHAVPILRGVLLAPSGVILHLSGNATANGSNAPTKGISSIVASPQVMGREGALTGSVSLASQEFVMLLNGYNNTDVAKKTHITASFDITAPNYFANVFNTNPLKIEEEGHLLYGHYDIHPDIAAVTGSGAVTAGGFSKGCANGKDKEDIALLLTSSVTRGTTTANKPVYEDFEDRFSHAKSPFVISQDNKSLFRVHLLSAGAGVSSKYKFSIENLRRSNSSINKYGTFDLIVRDFNDTDQEPKSLESFRGLSLDPASDRYIGRVIGDQHTFFNFDVNQSSQKIIVDGSHPVRSRFIRVELSDEVANGTVEKTSLPFGFRGPDHLLTSGALLSNEGDNYYIAPVLQLVEPPIPYRDTVAQGVGIQKRSDGRLFWGVQTTRKTSTTQPNLNGLQDKSFNTFVKHFPNHRIDFPSFSVGNNPGVSDVAGTVLDCDRFNNNKFTLKNILVRTGSDGKADPEQWLSASYKRAGGIGRNATDKTRAFEITDLDKVANVKFAKFTFIAQGGFDGINIFDEEKSKLSNTAILREVGNDENSAGTGNNTVGAYRKAIDIMSSKTDVDIQVLAAPGIRHASVTDFATQKIEDRFDAIYLMDVEERDQLNTVITSSVQKPHVLNTVTSFKGRALDSSFAAAYFPDVILNDPDTNTLVQVPPSVAVLGAYSLNDRVAHPWFAPAGFARGALNAVEMASVRLNRTNLDDLYEADINPITAFPGTGVTIWGQKTLQAANSALDRINVRRLLIDVRRKVKNVANSLLFEPNREETLERFTALVNPILQRVQEQSGIDRYKAVIDTSTTTQADVENNTIRGKIFLQPTRSVEFVALDFVVTNAGSNI